MNGHPEERQEHPWDDAERDRLRVLWTEGHSMQEIGRRLGRTKNSICGRVHRMELPSRPSPLGKGDHGGQARPGGRPPAIPFAWTDQSIARLTELRAAGHSNSAIGALMGISKNTVGSKIDRLGLPEPEVGARPASFLPQVTAPPVSVAPVDIFKPRNLGACVWPMWADDARPDGHFCGDAVVPGGHPYCAAHHRVAYTKPYGWLARAASAP